MDLLGPWHLLLIAGIFVILFGAKRLPDAARSLGKSARILKTELKDVRGDESAAPTVPTAPTAGTPVVAPVAAPMPAPMPVEVVTVPVVDRALGAADRKI